MRGHSENYFNDYRDHWWDKDFLDLMANRLNLHKYQKMLDVGCGLCHWSKLLVPYLQENAEVHAVDNDSKWAEANKKTASFFKKKFNADFNFYQAEANKLPFPDNTFDFVTCQTVLIHLKNPQGALKEMKRVLKPGGTILCVEPNNRVQNLAKSSISDKASIDETLEHVKYALICELGKKKLGHGDNSLGGLLPGMFAKAKFKDIEVRLSDKAIAMYPPYTKQEQRATLQQWATGSTWSSGGLTDKDYFDAAGKQYRKFFEAYQQKYKNANEELIEALAEQQYHAAGGAMMYLVSGVK
ncbi:class I SAM-dependent methyltransferase [Limibacter armeniacum]|uniref:class I SAM-dependent methyltransferase n=1 Tax=Limibacter armeniacum TaxID=466084 RepID=UPI002FE559FB